MSNKKGDILMEEIAESIISDIEQDHDDSESNLNNESKSGRRAPLSLNRQIVNHSTNTMVSAMNNQYTRTS